MSTNDKSVLIAPSLMAANMLHLEREVGAVTSAGADWLHVDIMDGHFVPNLTFGPDIIKQLRKVCNLPFDVHLMVEPVELCINLFKSAGADHITIHSEVTPNLHRFLSYIKELNCKAGVSINPGTPLEAIYEVLDIVDQVLIMSVNPGFSGQKFIDSTITKIKSLANARKNRDFKIIVDGGVNPENSRTIINAGADVLVAGNSIFKQQNYAEATNRLRRCGA